MAVFGDVRSCCTWLCRRRPCPCRHDPYGRGPCASGPCALNANESFGMRDERCERGQPFEVSLVVSFDLKRDLTQLASSKNAALSTSVGDKLMMAFEYS